MKNLSFRYRMVLYGSAANLAVRIVSFFNMVIYIRLTVVYLDDESFGFWMMLVSLLSTLMFLDLGLGNALVNKISEAAVKDTQATNDIINAGLSFVVCLSFALVLILASFSVVVDWQSVLDLTNIELIHELPILSFFFIFLFSLSIVSHATKQVFLGLQKTHISNLSLFVLSLFVVPLLLVAINLKAPAYVLLIIVMLPQVMTGFTLIVLLYSRYGFKFYLPKNDLKSKLLPLIRRGGLFAVLQLGAVVGWGVDTILITATLGLVYVSAFSVAQKLFQVVVQPIAIVNAPLWGAYADAVARGDRVFVKNTLRISLIWTFAYALLSIALIVCLGSYIVNFWTHGKIEVPTVLLISMGCFVLVESLFNSFAIYLNGRDLIIPQVTSIIMFIFTAIPAKYILLHIYGLEVMILGTAVCFALSHAISYFLFHRDIVLGH